jgi:hypothetical protein
MRRSSVFVLCLLSAPTGVVAQAEVRPPRSWLEAQSPACQEILGKVVRRSSDYDASDARLVPFANAHVAAIDTSGIRLSHQQGGGWALTDTSGEFRLRLLPNRTTVFEVKAIGYEPLLFAFDGKRYRAAVIEIKLGSSGFHVPDQGVGVSTSRGLTVCQP